MTCTCCSFQAWAYVKNLQSKCIVIFIQLKNQLHVVIHLIIGYQFHWINVQKKPNSVVIHTAISPINSNFSELIVIYSYQMFIMLIYSALSQYIFLPFDWAESRFLFQLFLKQHPNMVINRYLFSHLFSTTWAYISFENWISK